ncbi:hypothetical protein [Mycolicibacterium goodii]|uniref:Uncharacterized protein n=1 Tax=Mycolicibacterium goodii TaxID=134601 RepID=A0A0K0X6N1_MYCGD|nr:hypothetical protein AFA91_14885 [Mycolicibacterium goodii]
MTITGWMMLATTGVAVATPLFGTPQRRHARAWFEHLVHRAARRNRERRCYLCRTELPDAGSDMCPLCEEDWISDVQW